MQAETDLPRRIPPLGAVALMVGVMIGTGIFRTPPFIAQQLGSPALILGLWLLGGLLSFCGALTFAELATMMPRSGGVYVFLHQGLGRAVAFVFGWTYLLISKPFAAAGIAVIAAEHSLSLLGVHGQGPWAHSLWVNGLTTAILVTLTIVNVRGVGLAVAVARVLTSAKVLALVGIVALAFLLPGGSPAHLVAGPAPVHWSLALGPAMLGILWTYDGWADVGAVAGEVRDPQRNLPRVFLGGTLAVTGLYLAVNAAYHWVLPLPELRGLDTVAPALMQRLVGPAGGRLVALLVVVSAIGASHSGVLTGARVTFAQARDGLLFRALGGIHGRFQTPAASLWAQLLLAMLALWHPLLLGRPEGSPFQRLADGFTFTMWIFYGLAALSLFVLRVRAPDQPRPFRCWGYPIVPGLFLLASMAMTLLVVRGDLLDPESRGMATLPWLGVLLAGWPVWWLWERGRR